MNIIRRILIGSISLSLAGTISNPAHGSDPAVDPALQRIQAELSTLRAKVETQEAEIARLQEYEPANWQSERRQEEVRTIVNEILEDASSRASFASDAPLAGYNRGFYIRSADRNNELRIGLVSQLRYVANSQREADTNTTRTVVVGPGPGFLPTTQTTTTAGDDFSSGFQLRRMQIDLQGHFISPEWTYRLRLDAGNGGALSAAWAWVGYKFNDELSVKLGQLKPSFLHEENIGGPNQLAAERSYTADYFTTDFSQGIQLDWMPSDRLKLIGTVHTGSYSWRTDFINDGSDVALAARAEYLVIESETWKGWRQFNDFSSWSDGLPALLIGSAVNYEVGGESNTLYRPDVLKWTLDATAKAKGTTLFAAVVGQHYEVDTPVASGTPTALDGANQIGIVAQASTFLVPDKVEPFVRYEWINFDGVYYRLNEGAVQGGSRNLSAQDELSIATVGTNYYLRKHNAKFTLDVSYAFDAVPVSNTGSGMIRSATGDQWAVRGQFQFRF